MMIMISTGFLSLLGKLISMGQKLSQTEGQRFTIKMVLTKEV